MRLRVIVLVLAVIASGCVANSNTSETESPICDVRFSAYKDIHSEFENDSERLYGFRDSVLITGEIVLPDELPEGVNRTELLSRVIVNLEAGNESQMGSAYRAKKVCDIRIFEENSTFSCEFTPEEGRYILYLNKTIKGCGYLGSRGIGAEFYRINKTD